MESRSVTNEDQGLSSQFRPGPAIVELFRLEGVNGYKSIELSCDFNAKIVSAENGSGKTTLLNALYAILASKPTLLRKINFDRFILRLSGKNELIVSKKELSPLPHNILELIDERYEQLRHFSPDEESMIDALTKFATGQRDQFFDSAWFEIFYQRSPFDRDEITAMCEDLVENLPQEANRLSEIEEYVKDGLGGATVLYLPTYRRIEAEMPESFKNSEMKHRRQAGRPMSPYETRSSRSSWQADQLIYFGLEDVENRLKSIAESIRSGTFEAYTRIGGRTLEQLLSGPGTIDLNSANIDFGDLRVVLARLGKAKGDVESRISALIESGDINKSQHSYLRSFLAQLLEVYASNKEQEQAIEAFVGVINSYWSSDFNEKQFIFDKLTVTTRVSNRYTKNNLPLNALSSGEKQIVSIFARLYLSEDKRFIVLIDEPELSLSMEWQKRFLPDVLRSPSCAQMVAITHSPFVFDNDLDPFAGPLRISNRKTSDE